MKKRKGWRCRKSCPTVEKNREMCREYSRKRRKSAEYRKRQSEYYKKWYAENGRNRSAGYIKRNRKWDKKHPDKRKAGDILRTAVARGKIKKPERCENCDRKVRLSGHHEDYSQPLKVKWLCSSCHKLIHEGT